MSFLEEKSEENSIANEMKNERVNTLKLSVNAAQEKEPDRQAQVMKLSKEINLPSEIVERNYDELNKKVRFKGIDYDSLIKERPKTANFLANKDNAAIAQDDIPNLMDLEYRTNLFNNTRKVKRGGVTPKEYGKDLVGAAGSGLNNLKLSSLMLLRAYNKIDQETGDQLIMETFQKAQEIESTKPTYAKEFSRVLNEEGNDVGKAWEIFTGSLDEFENNNIREGLSKLALGTFTTTTEFFDYIYEVGSRPKGIGFAVTEQLVNSIPGLATGFAGAKAGAGAAALLGQAGPQAATPEEIVTVPLAGVAGFVGGSFMGQLPVEMGAWINQEVVKSGSDLSDPQALNEVFSDSKFMDRVKKEALRKGLTTSAVDAFFNMFAGKFLKGAAPKGLVSKGTALAKEAGVQAVGEATSEGAGQVAAFKGDLSKVSASEILAEGILSIGSGPVEAVSGMFARKNYVENPVEATKQVQKDLDRAMSTAQDATNLEGIIETAKESKVSERLPGKLQELVNEVAGGDEPAAVYFQADDFDQYFQAAGLNPEEFAADVLEDGGKAYQEAKRTGSDIVIPLSNYVEKIARTEHADGLLSSTKMDPEGMTLGEAQEFLKVLPQTMKEIALEASQGQDLSAEVVAVEIEEQLQKQGLDTDQGQVTESFFRTMSQRLGVDAKELFDRYNLKIEKGKVIAPQEGTQEFNQLEVNPLEQNQLSLTKKRPEPSYIQTIKEFFQGERKVFNHKAGDPKGKITFSPKGVTITLGESANKSTFFHENGHMFLEIMGDIIESGSAPQDVVDDYKTILDWMGVESRDQIETKHHEMWARSFEAYIMEGKAPSTRLKSAFRKFKLWLMAVYQELKNLNVTLTPELKDVMSRMLATNEEIKEASQKTEPLFRDPKVYGLSEEKMEKYNRIRQEATEAAEDQVLSEVMKDHERERSKEFKAIKAEVKERVENQREYKALSIMGKGVLPDGSELPEGMVPFKLSREVVKEDYDAEYSKSLPRNVFAKKESNEGVHPDHAAELLGFSSGDELLLALATAPKMKELIDIQAKALMQELRPDLLTQDLSTLSSEALNNKQREKVLRLELEYLASEEKGTFRDTIRKSVKRVPSDKAVKAQAKEIIEAKKYRELKPYSYHLAERKAAKQAGEALAKGDVDKAFMLKQKELLNYELYKAAREQKESIDKFAQYTQKFKKKETRERLGKAGHDYLDQIDAILERYEFKRSVSLKQIDKRKSLSAWIEEQREQGLEPNISDKLLGDSQSRNYKDLTITDLNDIKDAIHNIEHFAGLKNKLLKAKERRELDKAVYDAVNSIKENAGSKRPRELETRLPQNTKKRLVEGFFAEHRKMASYVREMDGFKDNGVMWDLLIRPMNEAGDREAVMLEDATMKLNEIFGAYSRKEKSTLHKPEFIPELGDSLSKAGQLSVALNWGNEDSRIKLMEGRGWSQEQVEAIINTLDERDWNFIKDVWSYIDSYWSESEAMSKRVNGVAPGKVQASPFMTKYGEMPGGYYPLKYDSDSSPKAYANLAKEAAERTLRGGFVRSTTAQGHRKERKQGVRMPVKLDLGVIFEHVGQVIHDQTHYEFLIDTNKILGDSRIQESILDYHGPQVYNQFRKAIDDVAAGNIPSQSVFERSINWVRGGTSIAAMGWNLMTSLQQPLGLTQSMVRVGPKWIARGAARWFGDATKMENTVKEIYGKSDFMRLRGKTQMREINEIRNQLGMKTKLQQAMEDSYFYMIAKSQMIADVPTWLGAYEKAFYELERDKPQMSPKDMEKRAIELADQSVIDSQGGGQIKDLAKIQRGSPLQKLWTNFYSYFNTTYNLTVESTKKTNFRSPEEVGRFAVDMLLLYTAPALLGMAIKEGLRGGGGDEEFMEKIAREQLSYLMGTMVGLREFSSVVQGYYGYSGPAGTRFFSEGGKLIKQVEQGEFDAALFKALNNTGGILFHYPAGQLERSAKGFVSITEGKTVNPGVLLVGPEKDN